MRMKLSPGSHGLAPYALALAVVGVAFVLREGLMRLAGGDLPPYLTFYPAVAIVALLGGFGPGLLATLTAALLTDYCILPPQGSFMIARFSDALGLAVFCGMGVFLSVVFELYRRARQRVAAHEGLVAPSPRPHRDGLQEMADARTAELTKANESLRQQREWLRVTLTSIGDAVLATGVARERLIGTDFSDYFTEPGKAREGYRRVFAEGFVRDYPLAIRHASGRVTDVLYNATVYRNEAGDVQGVSALRQDEAWRLSVGDNGIGIHPQFFGRIFILFQRLHEREQYPGTGIGLAICKKIVERHGGQIWVESEPGSGSTFHFTIPDDKTGYDQTRTTSPTH